MWDQIVTLRRHQRIASAVRGYLALGDYDDGGEEREVVVEVDGAHFGIYSAPQIREWQA